MPIMEQMSIDSSLLNGRKKQSQFNKLAQALALLSGVLLFALILLCVIYASDDPYGYDPYDPSASSESSSVTDSNDYQKSLIAIISPTILNVCTGCYDESMCNVYGVPEACLGGWARFDEVVIDGEIYAHITANITGFPPNSVHAWHIHESADSSGGDGFTLGGHFNPEHEDHGCPIENGTHRHVGDLGNVQSDINGTVIIDLDMDMIRFTGNDSIIGRSLILFQDPDECTTMAAGFRWGFGIIGVCNDACQEKFVLNSTSSDCFPEDWSCGNVTTPYPCCSGLRCEIPEGEKWGVGECIIDPTRRR